MMRFDISKSARTNLFAHSPWDTQTTGPSLLGTEDTFSEGAGSPTDVARGLPTSPNTQPHVRALRLPPEIVTGHIAPYLHGLDDLAQLETLFFGRGEASQVYAHVAPSLFRLLTGEDRSQTQHILDVLDKPLDEPCYARLMADPDLRLQAAVALALCAPQSPILLQLALTRQEVVDGLYEALPKCEATMTGAYNYACRKHSTAEEFLRRFYAPLFLSNPVMMHLEAALAGDAPTQMPRAHLNDAISSAKTMFLPFLDYALEVSAGRASLEAHRLSLILDLYLQEVRLWRSMYLAHFED